MSLSGEAKSAAVKDPSAASEHPLHISLLGEFSLRHNEQTLSLDTPSYQSLLAYLVIHAHRHHSRQQLAFQFWPDSNESQARTNLRGALYILRQTLPDADCFLTASRQTVQWRLDAPCVVDAWEFQTAVSQAQQTPSPADQQSYLQQAIAVYHGDLLPGFYDDWVLSVREVLRQQYLTTLEKLLSLFENRRNYAEAIEVARKLLREDPLHEAAYRRLMRLQSLDGNVAGALRTYHACSTRLQRELGVDPSPATQETYERLLHTEAPSELPAPIRLPLVAREQAWQTVQTAWKQCTHGQPGAVLIAGEAGIGKTRLAEELLDWAERQGIVVLTAVSYPSEKQLAYAPVANWLRSESLQPIYPRLDKHSLLACSRLLPELNKQFQDLPAPAPQTESWQRQHFFSGLDELWQRRIVREHSVDAYDFSHDKIRQGAYGSLSPARRRQFHQRVWRALETLHAPNLDPVSGQIAGHCEAAGKYREAISHYHRAALVAQVIYANKDTVQYLQQAIRLFAQTELDPKQQVKIFEQLGSVLMTTGRFDEAGVALNSAVSRTTDPWDICRLCRTIANVYRLQRNYDQAQRGDHNRVAALLPQVMAAAEEGNLQEYVATAESNLAWLKWLEGDLVAAKANGQKALAIWRTLPIVIPLQWTALWPLIDVALTHNELAEAVSYAETLLLPDLSRLPDELTAVLQRAISTFNNDQPETTRACLQSALQQARLLNQL